jgi:multiple sugar transport system permease protein
VHFTNFKKKPSNSSMKALLFVGIALVVMLGVLLYPLGKSFYISFSDRLLGDARYSITGLDNYRHLINDPMFWHTLWNSIKLTVGCVIGSLVIGLGIALLLNSKAKAKSLFTPLLFLPWAISSPVAALTFRWLYNDMYGFISYILMKLHITTNMINLLARPNTVWIAMLVPIIWVFYPFVTLVLLPALQSIDRKMYEAAAIDGANWWQAFLHVTLPQLKPVLVIITVLLGIWSFSAFDLVALLTGGGPGNETMTLSVYIYRQGHEARQLGYACTLGTIMFLILLAFTMLFFWFSKRSKLYEG